MSPGVYERSLIEREKQSRAAKRRWARPEYREKHTGPKHHGWKGGISANNAEYIRQRYHGGKTMKDNPECTTWLGIYVTERLLSRVFKDVVRMPPNNKGFDFCCAKNYKIDAKSSCLRHHEVDGDYWTFQIYHNEVADYFACLAFDNRSSLTPMHFWLIPGYVVNDHVAFRISNSLTVLAKWAKWERPLGEAIACCNSLRGAE
jgi:hypothetical protein